MPPGRRWRRPASISGSQGKSGTAPGPLVASVVALVVALTVLLSVVLPPASASGDGEGYRGSDQVGVELPRQRMTERLVHVVDHNLEHRPKALAAALRHAARVDAVAITLQEVCEKQYRRLLVTHGRWTIAWQAGRDHSAGCRGGRDGNVAIWTGGAWGRTEALTFRHQYRRGFHRGVACVLFPDGLLRTAHVCSTHLQAGPGPKRQQAKLHQAGELQALTRPWILRERSLVVVGGDLNAGPHSPVLDHFYALDGRGHFREATTPPVGRVDCRCAGATRDTTPGKIDYVFFSVNRLDAAATRRLQLFRTPSDHHLLVASARVRVASL